MIDEPYILSETEDYAVVYKPPFIHSVPLKKDEGGMPGSPTLLDWYGCIEPRSLALSGRKECEGGVLHRLDYETEGLVLIAKNQGAMDTLLAQQEQGLFAKEYGAISSFSGAADPLPGFPPFSQSEPSLIQSYFRPWGPGRKAVRPVVSVNPAEPGRNIAADRGKPYMTEVLETEDIGEALVYFKLRIKRGFRHQIRCHLSWMGRPILNDVLYGGAVLPADKKSNGKGALALRAEGFSFYDPASGEKRGYRIPALHG